MKPVYEVTLLFDFYAPLLTDLQRETLQMYYFDDMSLSEIGDLKGVSRSAVHELISRSESKLRSYEARLHLIDRFQVSKKEIDHLKKSAQEASDSMGFVLQECHGTLSEECSKACFRVKETLEKMISEADRIRLEWTE